MNLKNILLIVLLFPLFLFAQQDKSEWNSTKAIIKNIEIKRSGRNVKEIATVSYTTDKGEEIETTVDLVRIPFLGSFKSIGDEITINYKVENPVFVKTNIGMFLSKYGMYILIILGVIVSSKTMLQVRNRNKIGNKNQ